MFLRQYDGEEIPYHDACVLEILAVDNTRKLIKELEGIIHDEGPKRLSKLVGRMGLSKNVITYLVDLTSCLYIDNSDRVRFGVDYEDD